MTEFQRQWIAALRSDQYKQGSRLLRGLDETFCCLGVGCDLLDRSKWVRNPSEGAYSYGLIGITAYPSRTQLDQMGINDEMGDLLLRMNDGIREYAGNRKSFSEIADYLEKGLS